MQSKYSIDQLNELVKKIKNQILPSVFDKRNKIFGKLQIIQQENVLLLRSFYLLIYNLFMDEPWKLITHEDFMYDIFTTNYEKIENESNLKSMESQVFLNAIKQLNNNPRVFAFALIKTKAENKSFPFKLFSFSTFPAIFGFFSSSELCAQASLLLLDLISIEASDDILHPLIFSFFLSMIPFIEAFWDNFYHRFCDKNTITEDEIMKSFSYSISECSPLISAPAYLIMRELLLNRSELLKDIIVKSFLPTTFHLWYMYSNNAMSFCFGKEIISFLDSILNTQKGIMLSSLFAINSSRIDVIPSFITHCKFSSETLFFSNVDIKLFVEAFSPISSQIQLFEVLRDASKRLAEFPPFQSFPISFFLSYSKAKYVSDSIFDFPKVKIMENGKTSSENENVDKGTFIIEKPEYNPLYETAKQELARNDKVRNSSLYKTEGYQLYSLTFDLINLVEMAETQEYIINLKLQLKSSKSFQRSILNLRRYAFSDYLSKFIKITNIDQSKENIETKTFSILNGCSEKDLIIPTFLTISNYSRFTCFHTLKSLRESFLSITRPLIEETWKSVGQLCTNSFILKLVPSLSRRKGLFVGNYFYLLDQLLTDLRIIATNFYKRKNIDDEMIALIMAIIYSANTEIIFDIFIFYEKIAFRCPSFLSNLSLEQSKNWNLFIQVMWKTLEKDPNVLTKVMNPNVSYSLGIDRRNSV